MLRFITAIVALCAGFFLINSRQAKRDAVVVFGPPAQMEHQIARLQEKQEIFDRRKIAIFRASEIRNSSEIGEQLSIQAGDFAVVLVGANGRAAVRSSEEMSADQLLHLVDELPRPSASPAPR